ncbi:MAG: hypothetical protein OEW75_18570 [Cyclobacteriaceae bacterium]|nr:hypothetical protein [Cyclobacteriaceae bacterium]
MSKTQILQPVDSEKLLQELLIKSKKENTQLFQLLEVYINLVASGNKHWIEKYGQEIKDILIFWHDKYKTAPALGFAIQGYNLFFSSQYQDAESLFYKALDQTDESTLFRDIRGLVFMGLGSCFRSQGMIDQAMHSVSQGVQLIKDSDPPQNWHVYTHRMIGEIHVFIGEFGQAEKHYLRAKASLESLPYAVSPTPVFRVYDGLGYCYMKMEDREKSEEYFKKALSVEGISPAEKARVLCDLGVLYIENPEVALPYLEESSALRKKHGLDDAYSTSLISLAECYLKNGNIDKAVEVLTEAESFIEKYNVPTKKLLFYNLFAECFEKKGDYKQANEYFHLYDELQKNINSSQIKNIFQLKNKEIARQNQEIQDKNKELRNTLDELAKIKVSRRALFFSIITVVFLVIATEVFLDPFIEQYSGNNYLSLLSKIFIAFLLKPIDSLYERLMFRKALSN